MNNKFKLIITFFMIILVLILIWILVSYYKSEPFSTTSSTTPEFPGEQIIIQEPTNIQKPNNNDDTDEIVQKVDDTDVSNENIIDAKPSNNESNKQPEAVVISSSEQISNTQKQEVLNEIDKALMELLHVVDMVQPVDETRLGFEEGEVQE